MPAGEGKGCPCPECGGRSKVLYTENWEEEKIVVRHRECKKCGNKFETIECEFKGEIRRMLRN